MRDKNQPLVLLQNSWVVVGSISRVTRIWSQNWTEFHFFPIFRYSWNLLIRMLFKIYTRCNIFLVLLCTNIYNTLALLHLILKRIDFYFSVFLVFLVFLNFSFGWEDILKKVFDHIFKYLEVRHILRYASHFFSSRCLEMWSNMVFRVLCITSSRSKEGNIINTFKLLAEGMHN